jgi:hypothetical protein
LLIIAFAKSFQRAVDFFSILYSYFQPSLTPQPSPSTKNSSLFGVASGTFFRRASRIFFFFAALFSHFPLCLLAATPPPNTKNQFLIFFLSSLFPPLLILQKMEQLEQKPLFGGAMSISIPTRFKDVTELREVPDNQEVFTDVHTDQSIIIDLLEFSEVGNEQAAQYHFDQLAADNEATSSQIFSTEGTYFNLG